MAEVAQGLLDEYLSELYGDHYYAGYCASTSEVAEFLDGNPDATDNELGEWGDQLALDKERAELGPPVPDPFLARPPAEPAPSATATVTVRARTAPGIAALAPGAPAPVARAVPASAPDPTTATYPS